MGVLGAQRSALATCVPGVRLARALCLSVLGVQRSDWGLVFPGVSDVGVRVPIGVYLFVRVLSPRVDDCRCPEVRLGSLCSGVHFDFFSGSLGISDGMLEHRRL